MLTGGEREISIDMHLQRDENIVRKLLELYDRWNEEEQRNIDNGSGMRGSNSDLSGFSIDDLFNEVIFKLYKH